MVIRPLTAADFEAVYEAFADAFSDYVVPLTLTREQLAEMITRRGYVAEASAGAFDNDRLVAFTLNGVEDTRAYDTGTGVVRSHRRQGLGRDVMRACYSLLREHGCREYVLEVIDVNERAVGLYLAEGFVVSRGLQCWRLEAHRLIGSQAHSNPISPVSLSTYEPVSPCWDVLPPWQNSTRSIERATDAHVTLGNDDGYVIVFPNSGDVPQLAVRREARRRGVGTRLLHAAAALSQKPLRIMNVDERDQGIAAFLEHVGAERTVRQLEMIRPLS